MKKEKRNRVKVWAQGAIDFVYNIGFDNNVVLFEFFYNIEFLTQCNFLNGYHAIERVGNTMIQ